MSTHRLLADRLNAEPNIFRGCSTSELGILVILAIVLWVPACVFSAWALGAPALGLGLSGIAIVLSVVVGASVLQRLKRGRPDAYYRHQAILLLAKLGLLRSPFVIRQGDWDLGRTDRSL